MRRELIVHDHYDNQMILLVSILSTILPLLILSFGRTAINSGSVELVSSAGIERRRVSRLVSTTSVVVAFSSNQNSFSSYFATNTFVVFKVLLLVLHPPLIITNSD